MQAKGKVQTCIHQINRVKIFLSSSNKILQHHQSSLWFGPWEIEAEMKRNERFKERKTEILTESSQDLKSCCNPETIWSWKHQEATANKKTCKNWCYCMWWNVRFLGERLGAAIWWNHRNMFFCLFFFSSNDRMLFELDITVITHFKGDFWRHGEPVRDDRFLLCRTSFPHIQFHAAASSQKHLPVHLHWGAPSQLAR